MGNRVAVYSAVALGIVVFAGGFLFVFANSTELSCSRQPDGVDCSITRKFMGSLPISSHTISNVTDVHEDQSCEEDCSYRALLITGDGAGFPIQEEFTDRAPVREQLAGVKGFLDGTDATYLLEEPVPWWVVMLVGGLGLMALVVLAVNFVRESGKR